VKSGGPNSKLSSTLPKRPGTLSKVLFTDHYTAASRHLILLSRVTY
jgi:hypothetical protein